MARTKAGHSPVRPRTPWNREPRPGVRGRSGLGGVQLALLCTPLGSEWLHWLLDAAQDPGHASAPADVGLSVLLAWAPLLAVSLCHSSGQAASPLQELRSRAVRQCVCHLPTVYQPLQVSAGRSSLGRPCPSWLWPGQASQSRTPCWPLCFRISLRFPLPRFPRVSGWRSCTSVFFSSQIQSVHRVPGPSCHSYVVH